MLKLLSVLFFIIFVVPFLLRVVLRFLFGAPAQTNNGKSASSSSASSRTRTQQSVKRKVIPEDEGEYVDYEEVKD